MIDGVLDCFSCTYACTGINFLGGYNFSVCLLLSLFALLLALIQKWNGFENKSIKKEIKLS